jgi:hypothetical protein
MFILIAFTVFVVSGEKVAVGIRQVQRNIFTSLRQMRAILRLLKKVAVGYVLLCIYNIK